MKHTLMAPPHACKQHTVTKPWFEDKAEACALPSVAHVFRTADADVRLCVRLRQSRMEKFLVGSVANAVSKLITTGSVTLVV
jgi:hypothetical protein